RSPDPSKEMATGPFQSTHPFSLPSRCFFVEAHRMASQRHERQFLMGFVYHLLEFRCHQAINLTNFRQDAIRLDAETLHANIFVACRAQHLAAGRTEHTAGATAEQPSRPLITDPPPSLRPVQ